MHPGILGGLPVINLTIAASTNNYNIKTAAGNPSRASQIIVMIASGVSVGAGAGAGNGSGYAMDTGALPAGSQLKIINNGDISGYGGDGGGTTAHNGGDALNLQCDATIDNTNGYIRGGGGGGGQGANLASGQMGGGGGGGGEGHPGGAGGAKASGYFYSGANGANGSSTSHGSGGAGGTFGGGYAGTGGPGGNWGKNGSRGGSNSDGGFGAASGSAGNAINLNGHTVTWLGGNNSTQVLGPVS